MKDKIINRYDPKNNSFTILSIIMSILIIYFHSYPLFYGILSKKTDIFTKFIGVSLGEIIVGSFFTISGFMIITSLKKSKNIFEYLKKRIIKIFLPLIFNLLICSFIIVPIVCNIPIINFIKKPELYKNYIFDNIFLWKNTPYFILNAFSTNPYPKAINGSLWTIKHQFFMYFLIIGINSIILKKNTNYYKNFFIVILGLTMVSFTGYCDNLFLFISKKFNRIGILAECDSLVKFICYFCSGVFFNIYSDKISLKRWYFILNVLLLILFRKTIICRCLCLIFIPYIVIYLGSFKPKFKIKLIDISYQIYIWAFLIQQVLIFYLKDNINFYLYIILSIVITCIVSIFTYYITEWPFKHKKIKPKLFKK